MDDKLTALAGTTLFAGLLARLWLRDDALHHGWLGADACLADIRERSRDRPRRGPAIVASGDPFPLGRRGGEPRGVAKRVLHR